MSSQRSDKQPPAGPVGPVAFASQLRSLRERAGSPSLRELSRSTHFSISTLSEATSGKRLPSQAVVRALAVACGEDPDAWATRLRQASRTDPQSPDPLPDPVSAPPELCEQTGPACEVAGCPRRGDEGEPAARPRRRFRPTRRQLLGALLLATAWASSLALAAQPSDPIGLLWSSGTVDQHVSDQAEQYLKEPMDGDDPRARGCDLDASVTAAVPLRLPGGADFGQLRMRHSVRCGTSWGSALYTNVHMYDVVIRAGRPNDGAVVQSDWSNNTPPGSYGDMLSTAAGCVEVEAWVVTPAGPGPHARTGCLPQ